MRAVIALMLVAVLGLLSAACDSKLTSPLADAASAGDGERVTSLLRDGADPNARNINGFPPLICAAREGRIEVIQKLIKAGADPNLGGGVNDWKPLMHAIHKNQQKSVETLLDFGANANAAGPHGDSAFMMAAGYGRSDLVRLLLRRGADPRVRSVDGETALGLAVSGVPDIDCFTVGRCQTETVRLLLEAAPELAGGVNSWSRTIARVGGCSEVLRLLEQSRSAGLHRKP